MAKLTIDDLKRIKESASRNLALRSEKGVIDILVHMGTCGITAGARDVMKALLDETDKSGRTDIRVLAGPCGGMCDIEPTIVVKSEGDEPVIYRQMDQDKIRQVFASHVQKGKIVTEFVKARETAGE